MTLTDSFLLSADASAPATKPANRAVRGRSRWGVWREVAVLVVVWALTIVPGLTTIPPIDRDESRFAQASRQMLESVALPVGERDAALHSGGLAVPMLGDRPRLNKPPLIYWLQAGSAAVLTGGDPSRDAIWMYRVPGALCALGTVLVTWSLARRMAGRAVGVLAGAMLCASPLIVFDAHQARADQLLLLTTTTTLACLWKVWRGATRIDGVGADGARVSLGAGAGAGVGWVLALWVCLGASILAKGPIGPMVVGLTVLALCVATRRWVWLWRLRPMLGVVVVVVMVSPWVYLVAEYLARVNNTDVVSGFAALASTAWTESAGRAGGSSEHAWLPPGVHLALLAVLFWPGALLTMHGLVRAVQRARRCVVRGGAAVGAIAHRPDVFLLGWIVPAWVVFELVGAKLPHYVMPMYPAIAILSARAVVAAVRGRDSIALSTRGAAVGRAVWIVLGTLILAAPLTASMLMPTGGPAVAVAASVLLLVWFVALRWMRGGLVRRTGSWFAFATSGGEPWLEGRVAGRLVGRLVALGFAVSIPWTWIVMLGVMPTLFGLSTRILEQVKDGTPVGAFAYHEDSLLFSSRARVARLPDERLLAWMEAHPEGTAIVEDRLLQYVPAEWRPAEGEKPFEGFNPGAGRVQKVWVLRREMDER